MIFCRTRTSLPAPLWSNTYGGWTPRTKRDNRPPRKRPTPTASYPCCRRATTPSSRQRLPTFRGPAPAFIDSEGRSRRRARNDTRRGHLQHRHAYRGNSSERHGRAYGRAHGVRHRPQAFDRPELESHNSIGARPDNRARQPHRFIGA